MLFYVSFSFIMKINIALKFLNCFHSLFFNYIKLAFNSIIFIKFLKALNFNHLYKEAHFLLSLFVSKF